MTDPTIPDFNPGGVPDRVDLRDYQYSEVAFGTIPFDWSKGFDIEQVIGTSLPVKDQNGSFSCGGQAWSQYAGVLECAFTSSFEERSAKFFYAQTYQQGGGSNGRDNAEVFIKQGAAKETVLTSYDNDMPPNEQFMTRGQDITQVARNDAALSRGYSYVQVGHGIDDIAQAIRDNYGLVMGIDGSNNGTWASVFPQPPKTGENVWRHWIYAGRAKMIDGKKHIGCLNSWGKNVGDQGWQWISEDYFNTFVPQKNEMAVWAGWTHVFSLTPPPITFTHDFQINLKMGDSGAEVVALQKALMLDGVFPITVPTTGYFGQITKNSVVSFQVKYGITPQSGFCGPKTRAKLNALFNV